MACAVVQDVNQAPAFRHHYPMRQILFCLLLWPALAGAVEQLAFSAAAIEGAGWRADGVRFEVKLPPAGAGMGRIAVRSLMLPEPFGRLQDLALDCAQLEMTAAGVVCRGAKLTGHGAGLASHPAQVDFVYQAARGALAFAVQGLALYGGSVGLTAQMDDAGLRLQGQARALDLASLAPLLRSKALTGLNATGHADARFDLKFAQTLAGQAELTLQNATLNEASGKYATDKLALSTQVALERQAAQWSFKLEAKATGGQLYWEPLFVAIGNAPLTLRARGRYDAAQGRLALEEGSLQQAQVLEAAVQLDARLKPAFALQTLAVELQTALFPAAYAYVQPFLIGSALDALTTQGELRGALRLVTGKPEFLRAQFRDVYLHDTRERFSLDALNGTLHWAAAEAVPESRLRWQGGSAYKVPFDAAEIAVQTHGRDLALRAPLRQPFLGGAFVVQRLSAQALGRPEQQLGFDGLLEPIDLRALCEALGWPAFGGKLGGTLPQLSYTNEVLSLGGTLAAQVFDGEATVEAFRLKSPFGRLPQLSGNLRLRNIDLAQATSAFSFGRIDGRLHGDVEQLQLLNWRPVAFDAKLYTPADDRSRHRISQRAIENISSIGGGGASAVLSKGFLRFFDDFAYERIGLSCVLANGVCRMGGIEPKNGGYYMVKGALLPRIDVVGYAREVNWEALLAQLKHATAGAAPVIK